VHLLASIVEIRQDARFSECQNVLITMQ